MRVRAIYSLIIFAGASSFLARAAPETQSGSLELALEQLINPREADTEFAAAHLNKNAVNGALRMAGQEYRTGLGVEAETTFAVAVRGGRRLRATIGLDEASPRGKTVRCGIQVDGEVLWQQELVPGRVYPLDVDILGKKELVFFVRDPANDISKALVDWVEGSVLYSGEIPVSVAVPTVPEKPEILGLAPKPGPQIHGPRIFGVRPGHPFIYRIPATGDRPMKFSARELPAGLSLDPKSGEITGIVAQPGRFRAILRAENAAGSSEQPFRIEVGEQISLTPALGWNSWNCWAGAVDEEKILRSARAMVAHGLDQHGWSYINIDDTWQGDRSGADHALQGNSKFPDLKRLASEIHNLGLKLGIYSTPWITSYANFPGGSADNPEGIWSKPTQKRIANRGVKPWAPGQYSFAGPDARQWAEWGVDYLKYDWNPLEVPETSAMAQALRHSGRDIIYSLSNSAPFARAADWARLANSWRTTNDIRDTWSSMSNIGFSQDKWRAYAGPGHWNDPDMLVVGYVGWGPKLHPTRLTPNEQFTHISLWSLLSAPLLIGCDLERLDAFTTSILCNDEVLEISQDELGRQAKQVLVDGRKQAWVKELSDGSHAIGFFNLAQSPQLIAATWAQLGLNPPARVRDVWRQSDRLIEGNELQGTVPRHGVLLVRVWPAP